MSDSEFFSKKEFSFADTFSDTRLVYSSATGHTEVFSARKALKRFALKALKPELRDDPFYIGMLRKEFEIGFRLGHPGIINTYSFEEVEGLGPCIVLEWIEGKSLEEVLADNSLKEEEWQKVLMEICDALEYLEGRQIVHRDIKPSNIMLTADGKHARLIDFGFADSPEYASLKHSGGTRAYASPEQLSAEAEIKSTSDIYALGKVIEQLPIRKNNKIRSLIRRMSSVDPYERPQSAGEIKTELKKALAGNRRNIYIFFPAIVAAALALAAFLIFQKKEENEININKEEIKGQSVDMALPEIPEAATEVLVEKNIIRTTSPTKYAEPLSEERDSTEIRDSKREVHWMILLTAQQTQAMARKLREQGDNLWEEHTRKEIGDWVDSQLGTDDPQLRQDCHDAINRILGEAKRGE